MDRLSSRFNVSRETIEKLEIYAELLRKWNPRINLVSPKTLNDMAVRHFEDSLQLWMMRGASCTWTDLGSGGGFPGLVIALANAGEQADLGVTLIEADSRKAAFLRTVSRETSSPVTVIAKRIEDAGNHESDVISARALAPLTQLLGYSKKLLQSDGYALYLKGRTCDEEIEAAEVDWSFEYEKLPSMTSADGVILKVWDLKRVGE